jgi:hypothetical protein
MERIHLITTKTKNGFAAKDLLDKISSLTYTFLRDDKNIDTVDYYKAVDAITRLAKDGDKVIVIAVTPNEYFLSSLREVAAEKNLTVQVIVNEEEYAKYAADFGYMLRVTEEDLFDVCFANRFEVPAVCKTIEGLLASPSRYMGGKLTKEDEGAKAMLEAVIELNVEEMKDELDSVVAEEVCKYFIRPL